MALYKICQLFLFRTDRSKFLTPFYVPIINKLPPPNHISSQVHLFQTSLVWRQHVLPKRPFRVVIRHGVRTRKSVLMEGSLVSGFTNSCIRSLRNSKVCHHQFRTFPLVLMILFIVAVFMLTLICEFCIIILSICLFRSSLFWDITPVRLVVTGVKQSDFFTLEGGTNRLSRNVGN